MISVALRKIIVGCDEGEATRDAVCFGALIAAAVRDTKGKLEDQAAVLKALRAAKFDSVRGPFKYGKNHIPIQNFYLQSAEKLPDGWAMKTGEQIAAADADKYADKCNMPQ